MIPRKEIFLGGLLIASVGTAAVAPSRHAHAEALSVIAQTSPGSILHLLPDQTHLSSRRPMSVETQGFEAIASYITNNRREVDYRAIDNGQARVLAFGEDHFDTSAKEEVLTSLSHLKSQGYTHFGMEMVGTHLQEEIASFEETGIMPLRLRDYITTRYGGDGWYRIILGVAQTQGLKIVGIDIPAEQQREIETMNGQAFLERERDRHMASTVRAVLDEDPSYRIITFTGGGHASKDYDASGHLNMGAMLSQEGYGVISVAVAGNGMQIGALQQGIRDAQIERERFMLPLGNEFFGGIIPFDWAIHTGRNSLRSPFPLPIQVSPSNTPQIPPRQGPPPVPPQPPGFRR